MLRRLALSPLIAAGPCPFQGGTNQLWRNRLLALAIEASLDWPYSEVSFSVVRHPRNNALSGTLAEFRQLLGAGGRFSDFTSETIIDRAGQLGFSPWQPWLDWYRGLYLF